MNHKIKIILSITFGLLTCAFGFIGCYFILPLITDNNVIYFLLAVFILLCYNYYRETNKMEKKAMNKEDYVSLEVAKLLKEKGYPQEYNVGTLCRLQNKANSLYERTRVITQSDIDNAWCIFNEVYPTLYEAAKWLRDKHKVYVSSLPTKECGKTIWYHQITKDVFSDGIYGTVSDEDFTSYEESLNDGILEALKLI